MSNFQKYLDNLYANNKAMLIFYIILFCLALIFIILIIITSIKGKKKTVKKIEADSKEPLTEPANTVPKDVTPPVSTEQVKNEVPEKANEPQKSNVFLERPETNEIVNNSIVEPKQEEEEKTLEPVIENPVKEDPVPETTELLKKELVIAPVFPETTKPQVEPVFPQTEDSPKPTFLDKKEDIPGNINIAFPDAEESGRSISDLVNDEEQNKKLFETVHMDPIIPSEEKTEEVDIPKMKPLDDSFLQETPKEEPKAEVKPVVLSNEDIKNRLAKLHNKNVEPKEEEAPNELDDIMKSMGLSNEPSDKSADAQLFK